MEIRSRAAQVGDGIAHEVNGLTKIDEGRSPVPLTRRIAGKTVTENFKKQEAAGFYRFQQRSEKL